LSSNCSLPLDRSQELDGERRLFSICATSAACSRLGANALCRPASHSMTTATRCQFRGIEDDETCMLQCSEVGIVQSYAITAVIGESRAIADKRKKCRVCFRIYSAATSRQEGQLASPSDIFVTPTLLSLRRRRIAIGQPGVPQKKLQGEGCAELGSPSIQRL